MKPPEKKTKRALAKLRRTAARAEADGAPDLSNWESEFLESVEERLETYGSAFNDPEKGDREEALSRLQSHKLKEIDKKARGKEPKSGLKRSSFRRKPHPRADDES